MKRPALALLAPLLLVSTLTGCTTLDQVFEANPVTEKAVWAGAIAGGTPALVAFAPITFPLSLATDGGRAEVAMIVPALPTAFVGAVAFGLPTLILETIFRFPGRVWDHAFADHPADAAVEPPPEPQPDPQPRYRDWPAAREVPN